MLLPLLKCISSWIVLNVWIALAPTHAMEYIFILPPLPPETDAMVIFHTTHTSQFPVTANYGQTSFLLQFNKPQRVMVNIPSTQSVTAKGVVMEFFASNDFQINVYMVFDQKTFEVFLPVPLELWTSVYFAFTVQDSGASISVVTKESNIVNIIFYTQKGRLRFGGQEMQEGEQKEVSLLENQFYQMNLCYDDHENALLGTKIVGSNDIGVILASCCADSQRNLFSAAMLFNTQATTQLYITPNSLFPMVLAEVIVSSAAESIATVHTKTNLQVEAYNFRIRRARTLHVVECKGPCVIKSSHHISVYMVITSPGSGDSYCLLTPVEIFSTSYSIDIPTSKDLKNYVVIVVRHQQRLHILMDGVQVARTITKWEYAECEQVFLIGIFEVSEGNHHLHGNGFVNFGSYVYGYTIDRAVIISNPLAKGPQNNAIDKPMLANLDQQLQCQENKYFTEVLTTLAQSSSTTTTTTRQTTRYFTEDFDKKTLTQQKTECGPGLFGPRCFHYCGCSQLLCNKDGSCIDNAVCRDYRFFGSQCLFFDIMTTYELKEVIPDVRFTSKKTCTETSSIFIEFRTQIFFDFLYLKINNTDDEIISFELAFSNESEHLIACGKPRLVRLSETEIRINCDWKRFLSQVIVNFPLRSLCIYNIKISSGIDVAVGESTNFYIGSAINSFKKSMSMLPILQNNTEGLCLNEFDHGKPISWAIHFNVPKRVNYILMSFGVMKVDENNPITINLYNESDHLLSSQSLKFGRSSYDIRYSRLHLVSKIKIHAEKGELMLCEFKAIGGCDTDRTGLYCEAECLCVDECYIDGSCYYIAVNSTDDDQSVDETTSGPTGMWWKITLSALFTLLFLGAIVFLVNRNHPTKVTSHGVEKKSQTPRSSSSFSSNSASSLTSQASNRSSSGRSEFSLSSPAGSNGSFRSSQISTV